MADLASMEEEARAEWSARGFPEEEFAMAKLAEIWAAEEREELAEACAAACTAAACNVSQQHAGSL